MEPLIPYLIGKLQEVQCLPLMYNGTREIGENDRAPLQAICDASTFKFRRAGTPAHSTRLHPRLYMWFTYNFDSIHGLQVLMEGLPWSVVELGSVAIIRGGGLKVAVTSLIVFICIDLAIQGHTVSIREAQHRLALSIQCFTRPGRRL